MFLLNFQSCGTPASAWFAQTEAQFCRLNGTMTDRHPVPHIQNFSTHLAGTVIFTKVQSLHRRMVLVLVICLSCLLDDILVATTSKTKHLSLGCTVWTKMYTTV